MPLPIAFSKVSHHSWWGDRHLLAVCNWLTEVLQQLRFTSTSTVFLLQISGETWEYGPYNCLDSSYLHLYLDHLDEYRRDLPKMVPFCREDWVIVTDSTRLLKLASLEYLRMAMRCNMSNPRETSQSCHRRNASLWRLGNLSSSWMLALNSWPVD